MSQVFRVGYNLKGDKTHRAAEVTMPNFDPQGAREFVLEEMKSQRIERALVLIDCIELCKSNPAPTTPLVV